MSIVVLCGGVGGSRFLKALCETCLQEDITALVNTGDDLELFGLRISPDIDIVIYTLAGMINPATGWGIAGDTFKCLSALKNLGEETWFQMGDRDMAVQIWRTDLLHQGKTLTEVTATMTERFGLSLKVLPMCDEYAPTMIETSEGLTHFQHYLVKDKCEKRVKAIRPGGGGFEAAPGVLDAIRSANMILFAPSNPFVSIGTILAVKGVRDAIIASRAPKLGVSPLIGGSVIKGPAARMLSDLGYPVSSTGVCSQYAGLLDAIIIDEADAALAPEIRKLGMEPHLACIMLDTPERRSALVEKIFAVAEAY